MKKEITHEEIKANPYYLQAVKVAELVVIPDLSEDAQNYLDAVKNYETLIYNLNSITNTRFTRLDMDTYKPDLEEYNGNLESLKSMEIEIQTARTLHDAIIQAVEDGLHETAIKEQADRLEMIRARQMITQNAFTATRTRLEEYAKTEEQLRRRREKEQKKTA